MSESNTPTNSDTREEAGTGEVMEEVSKEIGRGVYSAQGGLSIDEHVDIATDKLQSENIVAFGLVAIRKQDGEYMKASHRAISHEMAMQSPDPAGYVESIHSNLVDIFDSEVAQR